jgi:hypothetical protein
MKIMMFWESWHNDYFSGRHYDWQTWLVYRRMWGAPTSLAVINNTTETVYGNEVGDATDDIRVFDNTNGTGVADFHAATPNERKIHLEMPWHSPSEMLRNHTIDPNAWYCIGPIDGWQGNYISGSSTLGLDQIGTADGYFQTHSPMIAAILAYTSYSRSQ